jgi:hypothetical protein
MVQAENIIFRPNNGPFKAEFDQMTLVFIPADVTHFLRHSHSHEK